MPNTIYEVCSESNASHKITSKRYTLERWCKNIYFEDGYSLSKSFWARTAQINYLTGRASQSALEAATPSNPGYDGGALFQRRTRQGCQKSARIKLLVDNMLGETAMLIIQMNFTKRAVKDKKTTKRRKSPPTSWLPSPPLYGKSGGKTVNTASFKKALATSQPIFKPKSPKSSSQDRFLWRGEETDSTGTSFWDF